MYTVLASRIGGHLRDYSATYGAISNAEMRSAKGVNKWLIQVYTRVRVHCCCLLPYRVELRIPNSIAMYIMHSRIKASASMLPLVLCRQFYVLLLPHSSLLASIWL